MGGGTGGRHLALTVLLLRTDRESQVFSFGGSHIIIFSLSKQLFTAEG